jgi:Zn finger protein HypA/HybF involved in hydrogenase expression
MTRKKLTMSAWVHARETYIGWCRDCGAERSCTEPDAREYECGICHGHTAYGADEWVSEGWLEVVDDET